jgi:tetratricopeptide (TPR) repeat protein/tRNA A-37 threonylcarbamoyl transferase component Bud32
MLDLHEGDMIGAYRISRLIGRGGMGIVYMASHVALDRLCALKFLAPSLVTSLSWSMFQNEAKTVAGLAHHTICQIYDLGIHRGNLPFYAMEYVSGKTLAAVLAQSGPLPLDSVIDIFSKMAEGLAYAHAHGIVHKDIKPANIMLIPTNDGAVNVKILDFGIAELIDSAGERQKLPVLGTAYYMSPEQLTAGAIDQRSDFYSLGCSMFEAITGRPPFTGTKRELSVAHVRSAVPRLNDWGGEKVPPAIEAIVRKCLAKAPDKRYQTAEQLMDDLALLAENEEPQFAHEELMHLAKLEEDSREKSKAAAISPNLTVVIVLVSVTLLIVGGYQMLVSYVDEKEVMRQKEIDRRKKKELARQEAAAAREMVDLKAVLVKANDAFLKRHFGEVIALVDNAFSKGAETSQLYMIRGMSYAQLEQPERAISDLKAARRLEPELVNNVYYNDTLANSYASVSENTLALATIERALKVAPDAERLRLKSQILFQLGRYADARDILSQALKMAPDKFWLYFDRGSCSASLNENEKAVEDFSTAIKMRPGEPKSYGARARAYKSLGKEDLARKDVERARQLGLTEWNYFESQARQKD